MLVFTSFYVQNMKVDLNCINKQQFRCFRDSILSWKNIFLKLGPWRLALGALQRRGGGLSVIFFITKTGLRDTIVCQKCL